jgi:hypothetical protein
MSQDEIARVKRGIFVKFTNDVEERRAELYGFRFDGEIGSPLVYDPRESGELVVDALKLADEFGLPFVPALAVDEMPEGEWSV